MVLTLSYAEHDGFLIDVFNNYFEKGSFMDLQFVCKGNKITFAHKLMVASVSSLVRKLISEMTCINEVMTIYLPEVNYNILNLLLTFLYEGVMKLDATELEDFKDVCNLLCVELPNAEISEVRRECVSPPTVPPSLAQRLERMSSDTKTLRGVPKRSATQSADTESGNSNVPEFCYQSVVVKQEHGDDVRQLDNCGTNAPHNSQVQTKPENKEKPNLSNTFVSSECLSGTQTIDNFQTDFKAEKGPEPSDEPPDVSEHCTAGNDVASLAISNVISLCSVPSTRSHCRKRTKAAKTPAKPKKKAKQSLPSEK